MKSYIVMHESKKSPVVYYRKKFVTNYGLLMVLLTQSVTWVFAKLSLSEYENI